MQHQRGHDPEYPILITRLADAVAEGQFTDYALRSILAYKTAIVADGDVCELAGDVPLPGAAVAVDAVSDSAQDGAAGTGMLTMRVVGLSSTYVEQEETVTLTGVAPVALTKTYRRITHAYGLTFGVGGAAAGNVTLFLHGAATVYGTIIAGQVQMRQGAFCVPAGYKAIIPGWVPGIVTDAANTPAQIAIVANLPWLKTDRADLIAGVFYPHAVGYSSQPGQVDLPAPLVFPETCDLKVRAARIAGAGTVTATVWVPIMLVPNVRVWHRG